MVLETLTSTLFSWTLIFLPCRPSSFSFSPCPLSSSCPWFWLFFQLCQSLFQFLKFNWNFVKSYQKRNHLSWGLLIKCHSPRKILLLQNDLENHTFLWLCNWLQFVENITEPSCENVGMPMEKQGQVVLHLFFGFLVRHQDHDVIRQFVVHIRAKFFLKIVNEIWRKSVNETIDKLFLTNFARMAARIFSDTSALKPSIFLGNFRKRLIYGLFCCVMVPDNVSKTSRKKNLSSNW